MSANSLVIKITHTTFLKDKPVQSDDLAKEQLTLLQPGDAISVVSFTFDVAQHLKLTMPGGQVKYVFAPHTDKTAPLKVMPAYKELPPSEMNRSIDALQPNFGALITKLKQAAKAKGIDLFINETLRSFNRQKWLYAQGRTRSGQVVTHALPGQSLHNYGVAIDCYPKINGKVVYNFDQVTVAMKQMNQVYDIAESLGLGCGARGATGSFIDLPHIQVKGVSNSVLSKYYPYGYIPGVTKDRY